MVTAGRIVQWFRRSPRPNRVDFTCPFHLQLVHLFPSLSWQVRLPSRTRSPGTLTHDAQRRLPVLLSRPVPPTPVTPGCLRGPVQSTGPVGTSCSSVMSPSHRVPLLLQEDPLKSDVLHSPGVVPSRPSVALEGLTWGSSSSPTLVSEPPRVGVYHGSDDTAQSRRSSGLLPAPTPFVRVSAVGPWSPSGPSFRCRLRRSWGL